MDSIESGESTKLPVPWKERSGRDLHYQEDEWSSGARGGGRVPNDFGWRTNPKQQQEENGSADAMRPLSR
jgi:hypothetical protein